MNPDIVILLPGLVGSVLSKDGRDIWNYSGAAGWRLKFDNALQQLELHAPEDETLDDLGDGVTARALVDDLVLIPYLCKWGGYSDLTGGLLDRKGLVHGRNFFQFPYDWRRSNRVSARKLAERAHGWLSKWRTASGNADARIVFIAHSMGGLVARYFIECLEGWKVTRCLVSIGTPFRGSGNAVSFLCNGFTMGPGPLAFDGTEALRSFDSVYQLLPIYPFVSLPGLTDPVRIRDVDLPNIDRGRAIEAAEFHQQVTEAVKANARIEAYLAIGSIVRPIVGTDQSTNESAKLKGGKLEILKSHPSGTHMGDGTVPRVSASPIDLDEKYCTYIPNQHSLLQSDSACINHLHGVLTAQAINDAKFRASDEHPIDLSVGEVQLASDPIVIAATPFRYVQYLEASIKNMDRPGDIVTTRLTPTGENEEYRAEVRLGAGAFQIEVTGQGLRPVRDVLMVVD
ncbi:hypothetical protein ACFSQQ_02350 [Mesorhizobium kowhaii]|uniref:lipase/acyltransferase domain-containing protein n=1 Tax=Mesorhizobium kowhaii TaxID=1300272 RepID=UPI0035EF15CD